jgi:hypothetical protein
VCLLGARPLGPEATVWAWTAAAAAARAESARRRECAAYGPIQDISPDQWDKIFDTNVKVGSARACPLVFRAACSACAVGCVGYGSLNLSGSPNAVNVFPCQGGHSSHAPGCLPRRAAHAHAVPVGPLFFPPPARLTVGDAGCSKRADRSSWCRLSAVTPRFRGSGATVSARLPFSA